jgi:ABC-type nitrate/sulfonate/bicarbonate transport system substrate-binding protein
MIDGVCGYRFKKTHRHGLCEAVIGILILISTVPVLAAQPHLEPVTIQLRWFHQFQFAGYYAAIEKGFYTDEGLQVSLREFEPGKDRIAPVLEGKAQYGVGDPSLLKLRMQGKPVVVLAQIFQHSPSVLIARRESGIFSADELVGKRVMLPLEDIGSAAIQAMILQAVGDLHRIPTDMSLPPSLLAVDRNTRFRPGTGRVAER